MCSNSSISIKEEQGVASLFTGELTPTIAHVCWQENQNLAVSFKYHIGLANFSSAKVLSGKTQAGLGDAIAEWSSSWKAAASVLWVVPQKTDSQWSS